MSDIREDITEINEDVTGLDQNVNFLFDEQIIQDQRLFALETEKEEIEEDIISAYFHSSFSAIQPVKFYKSVKCKIILN